MESQEVFEGSSIDEILEEAESFFDCGKEDLDYEILEETEKRNLLLKKAKWIRARVSVKGATSSRSAAPLVSKLGPPDLENFFKNLLEMSEIAESAEILDEGEQVHVDLVKFATPDLQAGKEILDSLQHLASRYLIRHGAPKKIVVDSQGLRQRRLEELEGLIQKIHDYVTKGKTTTTAPLTPGERRHIHLALDALGGVRTVSLGRGAKKRIRVFPKDQRRGNYDSSGY